MHASLNCATQVSQDNKDRDKEKKQHDRRKEATLEPMRHKGSWEYCCRRHDIDVKSDDESEETVTASKL